MRQKFLLFMIIGMLLIGNLNVGSSFNQDNLKVKAESQISLHFGVITGLPQYSNQYTHDLEDALTALSQKYNYSFELYNVQNTQYNGNLTALLLDLATNTTIDMILLPWFGDDLLFDTVKLRDLFTTQFTELSNKTLPSHKPFLLLDFYANNTFLFDNIVNISIQSYRWEELGFYAGALASQLSKNRRILLIGNYYNINFISGSRVFWNIYNTLYASFIAGTYYIDRNTHTTIVVPNNLSVPDLVASKVEAELKKDREIDTIVTILDGESLTGIESALTKLGKTEDVNVINVNTRVMLNKSSFYKLNVYYNLTMSLDVTLNALYSSLNAQKGLAPEIRVKPMVSVRDPTLEIDPQTLLLTDVSEQIIASMNETFSLTQSKVLNYLKTAVDIPEFLQPAQVTNGFTVTYLLLSLFGVTLPILLIKRKRKKDMRAK